MMVLTTKEKQILEYRATGMPNFEIARKLNISRAQVTLVFKKLHGKIKTVNDTVSLLKQTGYLNDTCPLTVTDVGLRKTNNLSLPTILKSARLNF